MRAVRTLAITTVLACLSLGAQASLFVRGGGTMVYDDVLDITILADWNYANTSGYSTGAGGRMVWGATTDGAGANTANGWIKQLNADALYGYRDWRLPTALEPDGTGPCLGFDCTGSEMGELFYGEFGASAGDSILDGTNAANLALFRHMQADAYWSGTENPAGATGVWFFYTSDGYQDVDDGLAGLFAVPVRDGDVPEPRSLALVLLALVLAALGTAASASRRRRRCAA
jgi:hypothetical protein